MRWAIKSIIRRLRELEQFYYLDGGLSPLTFFYIIAAEYNLSHQIVLEILNRRNWYEDMDYYIFKSRGRV